MHGVYLILFSSHSEKVIFTMNKPYLFTKLTLENFMMHHQTAIALADYPITLITGANGTGKTQILDSLILALGHHPKRLRKGKLTEFIGAWGKKAQITLQLANPILTGRRAIITPDKNLAPYLDSNELEIQVELTSESMIEYYLSSSIGRKHITRKEVRDLFESLHIQADNKLAFTEEGTVNIFADHSSKNKLDLLLETTGLSTYRSNLLSALDAVEKALQAVEPLKRKMIMEREYLENMEKARHLMTQKSELIKRQQQLLIEEAWSRATEVQQDLNQLNQQLAVKQKELQQAKEQARQFEDQEAHLAEQLRKAGLERDTRLQKWERQKTRLRNLDGQNQSSQRMLQKKKSKMEELQQKRSQVFEQSNGLAEKLQQIQTKIAQIHEAQQQIQNLRQRINPILLQSEYTQQWQCIQQTFEYAKQAQSRQIELKGPIIAELLCTPGLTAQELQDWIDLLGPFLLTFIVATDQQFQEAQNLFTELWPTNPPEIFIALDTSSYVTVLGKDDHGTSSVAKNKTVANKDSPTSSTTQAAVWHFIRKVAKWNLATNEDLHKLGKNFTCFSQGKIYFPWPGVGGRPHLAFWQAAKELSWEDWPMAFEISIRARELEEQDHQAQHELREIQSIPQLSYLDEQCVELQQEIAGLENEIQSNQNEYEDLAIQAEQSGQEYQETASAGEHLLQEIATLQQQSRQHSQQVATCQKLVAAWQQQQQQFQFKLNKAIEDAKARGQQPREIRTLKSILAERAYLDGQLANLQVTVLSEEEYQIQKERVLKLENEVVGSDTHLVRLKADMTKRFENWHKEVATQIAGISAIMNRLMSFMVQGVRLQIENLRNPDKAGLQIELKRHSQRWLDLAQLSGGEKVLTVEAMILALHFLTDSPLHAIDECTQRLDLQFKAQSFEMVRQAVLELSHRNNSIFSPQFILLAPDTLGVEFKEDDSCFRRIVLAPSRFVNSEKNSARA